ncbi:MAG: hypothetical protein ACK559_38310, partial [bacterium]
GAPGRGAHGVRQADREGRPHEQAGGRDVGADEGLGRAPLGDVDARERGLEVHLGHEAEVRPELVADAGAQAQLRPPVDVLHVLAAPKRHASDQRRLRAVGQRAVRVE